MPILHRGIKPTCPYFLRLRPRRRQWGSESRLTPLPTVHSAPSDRTIALSRLAIVATIVFWLTSWIQTVVATLVEERPHRLPREDSFGDHRAADHRPEVERDDCRDRNHRITEGVTHHDGALPKPLRAGGAHVVLVHHIEQAGAGVARVGRQRDDHERNRGKQHVGHRVEHVQPRIIHSPDGGRRSADRGNHTITERDARDVLIPSQEHLIEYERDDGEATNESRRSSNNSSAVATNDEPNSNADPCHQHGDQKYGPARVEVEEQELEGIPESESEGDDDADRDYCTTVLESGRRKDDDCSSREREQGNTDDADGWLHEPPCDVEKEDQSTDADGNTRKRDHAGAQLPANNR